MRKSIHRTPYPLIRELFRDTRMAAALTQVELGKRLKRSQAFVSAVETGITRLDLLQAWDWCAACGTDFVAFASAFSAGMEKAGARRKKLPSHRRIQADKPKPNGLKKKVPARASD